MPDDRDLARLAAAQHSVFARSQARSLGFTRNSIDHRVARGRWDKITDDIFRLSGAAVTCHSELMAHVLSGGPDAIASGSSALTLHGVRDFQLMPPFVVVGRRPPRLALPGVHESFRLLEAHCTTIDGIPCATAARALFDNARNRRVRHIAVDVDKALSGRHVTVAELHEMLDDLGTRGRDGVGKMRTVLASRDANYIAPASVLEERFLDFVAASGFPEPDRQVEFNGPRGRIGTVDFAWPDRRLVVETDGGTFHDSPTDRARDQRRDRALERIGYTVLRFNWNDIVHRPTSVRRILRTALARPAA